MDGSSLAPKWPILAPFCGMDHLKSNFSLIFDTLSVGGCWGQPMLLFWKLVDETQISKHLEPTRHHNSIKLWSLLSLRADLLYILQYETPCSNKKITHLCQWGSLRLLFVFINPMTYIIGSAKGGIKGILQKKKRRF